MSGGNSNTVFVGNLPSDVTEKELYSRFEHYGEVVEVRIKKKRSDCYAFIQFKDYCDAADAVYKEHRSTFGDNRLTVQLSRSSMSSTVSNVPLRDSYIGKSDHVELQVLVTRLPSSAKADELKKHMEQAGEVCYSEVRHQKNGTIGIVEFKERENMEFATKTLHWSEFINFYSRAFIDVKAYCIEDWPAPRSPSPSPRRRRSRSRNRSRSRSHSRTRSRSQSRSRSRSRSRSQSRSRSPRRSRTPSHSRSDYTHRRSARSSFE